jgi:thiol-disulfide isomerase/thioredoxin
MASESNPQTSGFFTPMRIVTVCALAAIGLGIWLSSSKTNQQPNQPAASATPVVQINPPAPNVANPAPPVAATVQLPDSIRQTKVKTTDGGSLKLADFKNKVLVVNLWATWCGPCRMEMPDLVKLNNEYKSRGLVVLGVATTYNEQAHGIEGVKEFLKSQKVDYKVLWDDGTLAQPLVQSVNGRNNIPQSFVISRDGKITKHFTGFSPVSTPTLMRQAVEDALADKGKA